MERSRKLTCCISLVIKSVWCIKVSLLRTVLLEGLRLRKEDAVNNKARKGLERNVNRYEKFKTSMKVGMVL